MKLLIAVAICTALLAAVDGKTYENQCIRLDVNGTVTVTANTKTNGTEKQAVIYFSTATSAISGDCSKNTSVSMKVTLDNITTWVLTFTSADNKVKLDQSVSFKPADLFNDTSMNGSVTLSNKETLPLSSSKESYLCDAQQTIPFIPKQEGNYSFDLSQNITFMQVQAFGLSKDKTFSPAQHCSADQTTVTTTTVTPTMPTPTPGPMPKAATFEVKDSKGDVCFKLVAGLKFTVEYETTKNKTVQSKEQTIPGTANVTGKCASGSADTATMTIAEGDYSLAITETRKNKMASSTIKLTVKLDPANFPEAAKANQTVSFELTVFEQSSADTFYRCDSLQRLSFVNTTTTLFTKDVQLQAFSLKNGTFSGDGVRCGLDPTPKPMPPAATPGDNTYTVSNKNVTCIVLTGEISFSNVSYVTKENSTHLAQPIVIPVMNESKHNVEFSGSCDMEGGNAQQLKITFNNNWTLVLTFAKGSSSTMLGATTDQYSVRDIMLTYYLTPEFFPNASYPNQARNASQTNITSDFMKGSSGGGSYKCDAKQTETIGDGIVFQTAKLQYKAFNPDNTTTFNNNVSECSADDESNSIVPIAVGAALAGLVAIVLIAYLIGRRRSRRQGYESV